MIECELCKREKDTKLYYEDETFWIADCKKCNVPIVVLKHHRKPIQNELENMIEKSRELFDMKSNVLDFNIKKIPRHFHLHIRKFKR